MLRMHSLLRRLPQAVHHHAIRRGRLPLPRDRQGGLHRVRAVRKGVPLRPSDLRQYPRAAGVRLLRERRKPAGAELQRRTVLRCQPLGYRAGRHRVRGGLRRTFPAAPHGGGDLRGTPSAARFQIPAKRPARHFPRDTRPPKGRPLGLLHGHGLPSGRSESLPAAGVRYAGDLRFGVPWYPPRSSCSTGIWTI